MNQTPLEIASIQYLKEPSLYHWLIRASIRTWEKLHFVARNPAVRLNEVTLTQLFLYEIWQLARTHKLPLMLYESRDEQRNGADIEIYVETSLGYIFLPTQAKILKRSNKYENMRHGAKGRAQIDLLLNYADLMGGHPLYLLYNSCNDRYMVKEIMAARPMPVQHFGMSSVSAVTVKAAFNADGKWKLPSFADLHRQYAFPFYEILSKQLVWDLDHIGQADGRKPLRLYSLAELEKDETWKNIARTPSIGRIFEQRSNQARTKEIDTDATGFRAMYRIIFPFKIPERTLVRIS